MGPIESTVVGSSVVFYEKGDTNAKPIAAIVVKVDDGGRCELATIPLYSAEFVRRHNVNHASTEVERQVTAQYGAWETIEESRERQKKVRASRAKQMQTQHDARQKHDEDGDDIFRIMKLHDEGMKPSEIVQQIKGRWTARSIAQTIRRQTEQRVTAGTNE